MSLSRLRGFSSRGKFISPKTAFVSTRTLATNDKQITLATLAEIIAEDHDLSKAESKRIVSSVFDHITEAVANKNKVSIRNFGTFESVHVASRMGRNPNTGQPLQISAKERVKFKAFAHLKEAVN